ncbi:phosphoheptose isomerase [Flavobacteriaceae bacterium]|jgi:mannose-6-phosphate isomerase-like protein (cupin superfamily)|nr:phosphoheptose isomerase [Flavobacteriaceae bacterium]MBT7739891.1 phosphoheptose isomerase [Cryomorphaceae bacterium]MDA9067927.1 phosphoheptose isomerase [Flavobacteriaceae bacterium]MDA9284954.1 phosphoheptose isomerase [Flavobacteriaceae bacterium]MDA9572786.1 phosphoheptose isomerase [Flavobacteriaceae bacterium]
MENKFENIEKKIKELGFRINSKDFNRPWGGFLVIDETQSNKFIEYFFENLDMNLITKGLKLSPKILIVKPLSRLSWQYHFRRSEIWKVFEGEVAVVRSDNDNEQPKNIFSKGSLITLKQGERHRLIGLNDFGVIAEIWQHTDVNNPSDENDIVRIQDDYGR